MNKRIFIGVVEIAGYYHNLQLGFEQLGIPSKFYSFNEHKFGYSTRANTDFLHSIIKNIRLKKSGVKFKSIRKFISIIDELLTMIWFIYILFKYDTFIFGFGQSILRKNRDLPILQFFNKTLIMNLGHGSEARPPFMNGYWLNTQSGEGLPLDVIVNETKTCFRSVKFIERFTNVVIGSPFSTSQFCNKPFVNWFHIGLPTQDTKSEVQSAELKADNTLRILHAPSNTNSKGTASIKRTVTELQAQGFDIRLKILTGVENKQVISEIQKSDLVIDQLYSDTPMAALAAEAASYGKPSIIGSYALSDFNDHIPMKKRPPSIVINPEELSATLIKIMQDRDYLNEVGLEAQKFIKEQWSICKVAENFMLLINNQIPHDWWVNPSDIHFFKAAGGDFELIQETISEIVKQYGIDALCLKDKDELKILIAEYYNIDKIKNQNEENTLHVK